MLLQKSRPFQIEASGGEAPLKKSFWRTLMSKLSCRKWLRGRTRNKTTKIFVSEEERTFSKIYDKCFFMSTESVKQSYWKGKFESLDRAHPPYEPESTGLICWQFAILIILWFHFFEIPLVIFFGEVVYASEFNHSWSAVINYLTILVLVLDSFIKLNTSYYLEGLIVIQRRKIIKRYMQMSFWFDLVALTVLIAYVAAATQKLIYFKLLFYIKCYDMWHYDNQIQKAIELNVLLLCAYRFFRVIIIFVIYSHWMACGFFYIDYYLYNNNAFYLSNNYLWLYYSAALPYLDMVTTYPWYVWYEYALYWALQTATTVGYGDITPKNPEEVLYTIINMIAMCVMFAYFINSVWEILGDFNVKSSKYKNNFNVLNRFLSNKNVSGILRQKLRAYLDYLWRQDTVEEVEELIISKLTPTLKDQLAVNIKYPFFLKIRLFNLLSEAPKSTDQYEAVKKELAHSLKEQRYSQGESIFECNELDTRLFYVLDGKVKMGFPDFESKGIISTAENFGQYEFVTDLPRLASAMAIQYSHVYYLERQTFIDSISKLPAINELFLKIRDDVKVNRKLFYVNIQCFNCFQDHSFVECPSLHYVHKHQLKPEYAIPKTEQLRQKDYKRYDFRESKMLMPTSLHIPCEFEVTWNYTIYYPIHNAKQIKI